MATPPTKPLLGMYLPGGEWPSGSGPSAWPSGPTTNLTNQYFAMVGSWSDYGAAFITQCKTNSLIPFVELEPWQYDQTPILFSTITSGGLDTYLTDLGSSIAASGKPCIITFGHEMNVSGQYPWSWNMTGSGPGGGNLTAAEWITGWKYVRAKVNSTAGGLALWMWACSADTGGSSTTSPVAWWPGSGFLDMVGVDGYEALEGSPTTFAGEFNATLSDIRGLGWSGDVYLAETNLALMVSSGGDSIATFVADMYSAGMSGILEYEESGLPGMTSAQWTQYNTAVAAHYGGGGGGGGAAKFATLTDAFPGTSLSAQWTGTATVSGGECGIPCTSAYGSIQSTTAYDLTSSHVKFGAIPFTAGDGGSYVTQILLGDETKANGYIIGYDAGELTCYGYVNYVGTTAYGSVTYNPATMAYWMVSESGGTITFSYSGNGSTWTTLAAVTDETIVAPTSMYASFESGWYSGTGTNGTSYITDFNVTPAMPPASGSGLLMVGIA